MSPGHCSCPECGTILRVRDRSFVGRQIECPDCHVKLVLRLNDDRQLLAERPPEESASVRRRRVAPATNLGTGLGKKVGDVVRSPLALAWALALSITAFVAILMLRPAVRFRPPAPDQPPSTAVADSPAAAPDSGTSPVPQLQPVPPGASPDRPVTPAVTQDDPPADAIDPVVAPEPGPADLAAAPMPSPLPPTPVPKPAIPAPAVVKIDVEALLRQPLRKYKTERSISRQALLEQVEEMLGAPIRYNAKELGEQNLERPVSIDLEGTTVGGVLKTLLDSAGWEFIVEETGIRLKPRRVATDEVRGPVLNER